MTARPWLNALSRGLDRCAANFARAYGIVAARWRRRPVVSLWPRWGAWPFFWAAAILILFLTLDIPAGEIRNDWPEWLAILAVYITDIGLSGWYLIPAAVVVILASFLDWRAFSLRGRALLANWTALGMLTLAGIGLSGLFQTYLKTVFGRARMRHFDELGAFHFRPNFFDSDMSSFPSGHATTMGAVAAIVWLLHPPARPFILPAAIIVAASRVVAKAHFPSDVVAGFGLGFAGAVMVALLFARLGFVFRYSDAGGIVRKPSFRLLPRRTRRQVSSRRVAPAEPMAI